jgi:predicted PurR-regulated permease PerM
VRRWLRRPPPSPTDSSSTGSATEQPRWITRKRHAVRPLRDPPCVPPERVITVRPRTVLMIVGILLGVAALLKALFIATQVVTWVLIAVFLALALNPAVDWLQAHGVRRRGLAVAAVVAFTVLGIAGIGALFIPTLVNQVNDFVNAVPGYVEDLTKGRGRLGFLETKYHIVERIKDQIQSGGAERVLGLSGTAVSITKSVVTIVVASITIAVMTIFMLLEGPGFVERFFALLPPESEARWRAVGRDVYRTVGGYVSGNLLISLIAGVSATIVLAILGVPFSVALGVLVALFDLVPLAGATIAAVLVSTVGFLHSLQAGIVLVIFFVVYQQVENHLLQPVIYGRTVALSPLVVLIAVLIGASLAGILGALGAIPIAGTIQVVVRDALRHRRDRLIAAAGELPGATDLPATEQ